MAVALQFDGKIVTAGYTGNAAGSSDVAVVRYNADGTLDSSFGAGGKVITTFGTGSIAYSVAIQPADQKIVIAGSVSNKFLLIRYNANGSLDTSFDGDGIVTTQLGNGDTATGVAMSLGGKIVAAGLTYNGANWDFGVARYNPDGSLDTTFDGDGKTTTAIGAAEDIANSVAIQADGKIVAAGDTYNSAGSNKDFAVVRYNVNGSLDTSFGGTGKVVTAIGTGDDIAFAVAIQPDGRIVAAGYGSDNILNVDFALARYNADGTLDTSFDSDGMVRTAVGPEGDAVRALAVQTDGKIVAAGYASSGTSGFAAARYNLSGSLDSNFGTSGIVVTPLGTQSSAYSAAIQPDGKIVAAGIASDTAKNNYDFAVVRYAAQCAPTAAHVVVSGWVLTAADRMPIGKARVTFRSPDGVTRMTTTNSFGYFTLPDIEVGSTYIVSTQAKGYTFSPRTISVVDAMAGFEVIARPN